MRIINGIYQQGAPIKTWCEDLEDGALEQAVNLSRLPFLFKHVALMPDCHQGYGMPIGGVIACKDVIIPNAVGVDIGCGMCAFKTDFPADAITTEQIRKIMGHIRQLIPVGMNHHKLDQEWAGFEAAPDIRVVQQNIESARRQLGTLGGGNHFIEIQRGDDGLMWLMLHSGSRNIGYKIANHYHNLARNFCEKWYSNIPTPDLSFLPADSPKGQEYIAAMNFALDFAFASRESMLKLSTFAIKSELDCAVVGAGVNIHHNFAALESHFGKNVWVHRKGATMARSGQFGIIPGSMGTPSYIVRGLGNRESFMSCSHGAGRKMSRSGASNTLTEAECNKAMEGIVFGRWGKHRGKMDFGEAPQAYKDINEVIAAQSDLVEPVVKLWPLGVVKA